MRELEMSAGTLGGIQGAIEDFWEYFGEVMPAYAHHYLESYCKRLSGIEALSKSQRNELLEETVGLLDAMGEEEPFKNGVRAMAIQYLAREVWTAIAQDRAGALDQE